MSEHLAFNTAASFTTNTNWQSYGGESTMSYFSQMVALAIHNFVSAAVGIGIAAALVRGIARHTAKTIGNFWVDLVRSTYYLLLPICVVFALVLVSQGMIQNFKPYDSATLTDLHDAGAEDGRQGRDDERRGRQGRSWIEQVSRDANHRAGPDGLADRDQDARHQWRRLHQCQRRASF